MYNMENVSDFLTKNTAIIGKRESGKTTLLKEILKYCYEFEYTVLLFDSATDHKEKSLLVHAYNKYPDSVIIESPEKEKIFFDLGPGEEYPYIEVNNTNYLIYGFDVAKYLEEGYETDNLEEREKIRMYYKQLAVQELNVMLPLVYKRRTVVIMDEIEFTEDMEKLIQKCSIMNIPVIAALHNEESLSTSHSLFNILSLD